MKQERSWRKVWIVFVVGALFGAISTVQFAPRLGSTEIVAQGQPGTGIAGPAPSGPTGAHGVAPTGGAAPAGPAPSGGLPPARAGLQCAPGRNGGATDVGVTGNSINLATTVVQSGIGAAFLGDVRYAMEAVRNQVNHSGGICGRQLNIQYIDDGWDAQRGAQDLRNIIKSNTFAIPVAPSSEGLRIVVDSGDIDAAGIPVVGTDGMLIDQYLKPNGSPEPWLWPVAVATASTARIMALDAYNRGARHFGIVFDKNYRFGAEAALAYNNEVRRLTHANVDGYNSQGDCERSFCGVLAGQSSYSTEIQQFKPGDYVAMFLEPTTALTWMSTPGAPTASTVKYGVGGAQPLFTASFATNCQSPCDGMTVWTSYKPPINDYANDPVVSRFVNALKVANNQADPDNAFAEGGYVGMELLVQALQKVGPDLTRARLRAALETITFNSGLTLKPGLRWGASHFANTTMQAFSINFKGEFSGWRTGQIASDPNPSLGTN